MHKYIGLVLFVGIHLACNGYALTSANSGILRHGAALAVASDNDVRLENEVLAASWSTTNHHLAPAMIADKRRGAQFDQTGATLFQLSGTMNDQGRTSTSVRVSSADCELQGQPTIDRIGQQCVVSALLLQPQTGIRIKWSGSIAEGAHYLRQKIELLPSRTPYRLNSIQLLHCAVPHPGQVGEYAGSPVKTEGMFFGMELPVGENALTPTGFTSRFTCDLEISADHSYTFGSVIGAYPDGQLRRAFLKYLEEARGRPFKRFLHYNGWYDFGMNPSEAGFARSIQAVATELTDKRHVRLDAYVMDDGWDDLHKGFWDVNLERFPNGYRDLKALVQRYDSHLGTWISPRNGNNATRTALAAKQGLVGPSGKLDLSYPPFYQAFLRIHRDFIQNDRFNYFKWDYAMDGVTPHAMALFGLAGALHQLAPDLFINVTSGSWPSPFWLLSMDSTWRQGADVDYCGKGDIRERWITYRDKECYNNVVTKAPLYPLNSIMLCGIVHGRIFAGGEVSSGSSDLRHEARSYFACGTKLQELYLSPERMNDTLWDQLAEAAKWNRRFDDILTDTHWVGGDANKLEVYGWASWSMKGAVLALRNPDDQARSIDLDVRKAFELPADAPQTYKLTSPYPDQRVMALELRAGTSTTIRMEPFEVLVWSYRDE